MPLFPCLQSCHINSIHNSQLFWINQVVLPYNLLEASHYISSSRCWFIHSCLFCLPLSPTILFGILLAAAIPAHLGNGWVLPHQSFVHLITLPSIGFPLFSTRFVHLFTLPSIRFLLFSTRLYSSFRSQRSTQPCLTIPLSSYSQTKS